MENKSHLRGIDVLRDPDINKSTAFTAEEREQLGLRGLLPPAISTQQMQITRVLENLRRQSSDIDRYIFLRALQGRNRRLFYRTVIDHIEEIMPIIYTPTVGEACLEFAHIYRHTRALFITPEDKGQIPKLLDNWEKKDIRVIVVTDGERVLGLGDLGGNGAGIPIGKLSLYVACAGIRPEQCLPVMLDVGTENETLLDDPLYLGLRRRRLRGPEYMELLEEFVAAVQEAYPDALIQFEDFATENARSLLGRYRDEVLCFNDDIQGTAAVALAGVIASTRITDIPFRDLKVMFLGKGSAAAGIADLMVSSLVEEGVAEAEARSRIRFVDRKGLITRDRRTDDPHQSAAGDFRAFDPPLAGRVHGRGGLRLEQRPRHLCQRQSFPAGDLGRTLLPSRPGQQRVHLPRHRPRRSLRRGHAGAGYHVPHGRPDACGPHRREGPRGGHAVPAAHPHPRDIGGDRHGRRRTGPRRGHRPPRFGAGASAPGDRGGDVRSPILTETRHGPAGDSPRGRRPLTMTA